MAIAFFQIDRKANQWLSLLRMGAKLRIFPRAVLVRIGEEVKNVASLTCANCANAFQGRRDRLYCSPVCKQKARVLARERKRQEAHAAWLASMTPEERAVYDSWGDLPVADWSDLPTTDWSDLPTWEEIMATNEPETGRKEEHR